MDPLHLDAKSCCYVSIGLQPSKVYDFSFALDKLRHQLTAILAGEKHEPSIGNLLKCRLNNCLVLIPKLDPPALHRFDQCIYCFIGSR